MNFLSLIEAKREGHKLTRPQIQEIVSAYTSGAILDYQMTAWLMAVYFQGLDTEETAALTLAMRDSGDVLEFPRDPRPLVDKHSTGGVGDKVSLPLAPLLACLGFRVPMISGRGLGITGGTLDKLDSIPGFKTSLPAKRIVAIVQRVGCIICGQTDKMVPADKGLYALRDVTATVPSIPLIVSSILSKKLAENLRALVLDVKFGAAAFMPTKAKAGQLAKAMVALGNQCGVNTRAILTPMDAPLGRAAGNWLEVKESVECLENGRQADDLRQLVLECAAQLLVQTRKAKNIRAGKEKAAACLASGEPRKKWDEMLEAQGAELRAFSRKLALDRTAPVVSDVKAPKTGFVTHCDAKILGEAIRDLGGGRATKESSIDYDVGVDRLIKPGEGVRAGDVLGRVHAANQPAASKAATQILKAFEIGRKKPSVPPLVEGLITG